MTLIIGETLATKTAQADLITLSAIAKQHAAKIKLIFEAVATSDRLAENVDERFLRITGALNQPSIPNAFRNLVMAAFTSETGLSFSFANVAAVITSTRQAFNSFARRFVSTWGMMLLYAIQE